MIPASCSRWQQRSTEKGDVLKAQGDLAEALKDLSDSLAITERLGQGRSRQCQLPINLPVAYDKVGGVLKAQGNLPAALKAYQNSLAIADRLARGQPDNTGYGSAISPSPTTGSVTC